jgi:hypothetical protein
MVSNTQGLSQIDLVYAYRKYLERSPSHDVTECNDPKWSSGIMSFYKFRSFSMQSVIAIP